MGSRPESKSSGDMASVEAHEGGVALDREAPAGSDAFGLHPREVDDDTIVAQGTAGDVVSATSKSMTNAMPLVLPSLRHEQTILRARIGSHKIPVNFR